MSFCVALASVGIALAIAGHYRGLIAAMRRNPVTKSRIIPRTLYDDSMGVDWVSQGL